MEEGCLANDCFIDAGMYADFSYRRAHDRALAARSAVQELP